VSAVFGELDPTGQFIHVTCTGGDHERNQCAAVLRNLTPNFNPTANPDVMAVPLSWAAVTQLAHGFPGGLTYDGYPALTWLPGAELSRWLMSEIIRRSCDGDFVGEWPKLDPMRHQLAGAVAVGMNGRFLFADDMGVGKSGTYLMSLASLEGRNRNPWPALFVTPASVVDTVLEEIQKWYPDWRAVAYRGTSRQKYLKSNAYLLVMGYETMRSDTGDSSKPGPLMKFKPGTVIFDECVTYDTLVEVRGGVKHICYVQPGEQVKAVDHETGAVTWAKVARVGRSPLRETVRIGRTEMSLNHPVWVSDDGCIAYATGYDQGICLLPVWGLIQPEVVPVMAGAEVLRENLRAGVAGTGPGPEGSSAPGEQGVSSIPENTRVPGLRPESVPWFNRRSHTPPWAGDERRERVAGSYGRQWQGAYYPAGAVAAATRRGVHPRVLSKPWPESTWVPDELQAGPGEPGAEDRNRAARREPPGDNRTSAGRKEAAEAGVTWLDRPGLLERGDPERSLWNIETDTGNYFANGILTHNCHSLCNYDSLQSRKARALVKHVPNVIAGSGTPITSTVVGFWPVLNSMYPASYPSRDRYKAHYCIGRKAQYGNGDKEITGIDPAREAEFRVAMQGVFRRVAAEDVLDLPEKSYQVRYVEIPAAWRAAYDQMEEDMLAELPDQMTPLEANVAVVKMMRLRQLACSACDVEVTREIEDNPRSPKYGQEVKHTKVTLKEPCWKGAALVSLLDEIHQAEGEHDDLGRQHGHRVGSRPVLAFAEHAQLTRLAGAMAERKGYVTGYIDGDVSQKDRTAARLALAGKELDLLCVTTGAGGVGLNLTTAADVAFLANPWGYVPRTQSERRSWRRGQDKPVRIYDFVTKDSVESRIAERLRDKAGNLADLVLDRRIAESFLGGRRH
jgi:hypothetical protein